MSAHSESTIESQGSLARRLVGVALLWALVLLILCALALTGLFRQTVMRDLDDRLARVSEALVAQVEVTNAALSIGLAPSDPSYGQAFSGRYWQVGVLNGSGFESTLRSNSLADETLPLSSEMLANALTQGGEAVVGNVLGPGDESLRIHLVVYNIEGASGPLVFAAAENRAQADARITRFALAAAGILTVFSIVLAIGVFVQVRMGLAPVLRLGRAVADIRDGRSERISGAYPAELIGLGGELNGLLDHSREVVDRARTHVGNLAHALKTPITVLSNEARLNDGTFAELVARQSESMQDQVEHHLRRARAAANAQSLGARTSVEDVVSDLGRTLNKIYGRNGIEVTWSVEPGLIFRGERQDLEDLVGNLMDNGCKWASQNVKVIAKTSAPGSLTISVNDDGPGLSAEARDRVLERGVRLDEQAPGSGLGLSIVSDLARAYGGSFTLQPNAPNGLRALLNLPGVNA